MDNLPTEEAFAAALNTTFDAATEAGKSLEITLVEVKSIVANKMQECFALLFRAPLDAPAEQQQFQIEHNTLGKMEIFLVPVKKDDDGLFYEAVFNKLLA